MGKKIFKLAVIAAVVIAGYYLFSSLTGGGSGQAGGKQNCRAQQLKRRRRVDGKMWQPQGVLGPRNQGQANFAPPLAPVNPR